MWDWPGRWVQAVGTLPMGTGLRGSWAEVMGPFCPSPMKRLPVLLPTETHPRPPKPDPVKSVSGVLSSLTPAKSAPVINNGSPTILGKRSYEQHNGVDGESGGAAGGAS